MTVTITKLFYFYLQVLTVTADSKTVNNGLLFKTIVSLHEYSLSSSCFGARSLLMNTYLHLILFGSNSTIVMIY